MIPAELSAARAFRAAQRAILEQKNASDPPGITVSVHVRNVRHDCPVKGGKSVSLELREHYVFSPAYISFTDGQIRQTITGLTWISLRKCWMTWTEAGMRQLSIVLVTIPAKRFGFIFTEGRCGCGMTARSGDSRLVDPAVRPPSARSVVCG